MKDVVFVCGARDFHAMDKYYLTSKVLYPRNVLILTDLVESEGQPKLIKDSTPVYHLFNIDRFLFKKQSSVGNIWRNILKILVLPVQVYFLKKFYKSHTDYIYHAIPMYYMLLCYFSKVPFIATPQGSEILVRPGKSKLYKKYAIKSLRAASKVIVDSINMQRKVKELSAVEAVVMKNGFNTSILLPNNVNGVRNKIVSMRGLNPNYQIGKILDARSESEEKLPISLVYPFSVEDYKVEILNKFIPGDEDLGRLNKDCLYKLMSETLLAISIPVSDSSPRSVYECIFAGACVAITYSSYFDELPQCMRDRIYLVNLEDKNWFESALDYAKKVTTNRFIPTQEALEMCNEELTIRKIVEEIYA